MSTYPPPHRIMAISNPAYGLTSKAHHGCLLVVDGLRRVRQLIDEGLLLEADAACAQIIEVMERYAEATRHEVDKVYR